MRQAMVVMSGSWLQICLLLLFVMQPLPIAVCGYNPLALNSDDRTLDVMEETCNFDAILIAGTCRKHVFGGVPTRSHKGATMFSSGFVKSKTSNASCGTAVIVGKKLAKCRVHPIVEAPPPIAGRGMSVRVSSRWADFSFIVGYFPPAPGRSDQMCQYRSTCRSVCDFLHSILLKTPGCSTPIIYVDLNDGMGIRKVGKEWQELEEEECHCIAKESIRREKIPGGAGELFRSLLLAHQLASLSSWTDSRPTFYGNYSESLIDHLCGPVALIDVMKSSGVLSKLSTRLQLINKRGLADHLFVHTTFWYLLQHPVEERAVSPQQLFLHNLSASEIKWDNDLLMRGCGEGFRREDLISEMEKPLHLERRSGSPSCCSTRQTSTSKLLIHA